MFIAIINLHGTVVICRSLSGRLLTCNQGPCTCRLFVKARGNRPGHNHPVCILECAGTKAHNKTIVPCGEYGAAKTVWHFCFWAIVKTLLAKLQGYHRRRRQRLASGWSCHLESRMTFAWSGCSAPWLCFWVICRSLHGSMDWQVCHVLW